MLSFFFSFFFCFSPSSLSFCLLLLPYFLHTKQLLQDRVMREISLVLSGRSYCYPGSEGFDSLFIPTTRDLSQIAISGGSASISLM